MTEVNHLAAAWDWLLRLREEAVTQRDLTEWLHWYEADEQHKRAFERVQAFWLSSGQVLEGPGALSVSALLSPPNPLARASGPAVGGPPRITRRAVLATAAGVLALTVGVTALKWPHSPHSPRSSLPPMVERSVLPDGSRVDLAPRSQLEVHFTPEERMIEIGDGEAFFSVAHNRARPFVVRVGSLRVRAVGTAFDVRKTASRVAVTVSEGVVEVSGAGPGGSLLRLGAGEQLTSSEGPRGQPVVAPADVSRTLAWRQGRLEYLKEPLASVIADVNRYREHPVLIRDESVGRILFSGTVFTAHTDVWVKALPRVFPVHLSAGEHGELILTGIK